MRHVPAKKRKNFVSFFLSFVEKESFLNDFSVGMGFAL